MGSWAHGDAGWLAVRAGAALLAVVLALAGYAAWLHGREHAAVERRWLERQQTLAGEQKRLREDLAGVSRGIAGLQTDLAAQDERRQLAEQAAATLRAGDSWWRAAWQQLFGDAAAARTKEEIRTQLEQAQAAAAARGGDLRAAITRATWERDGLEIALGRAERRLAMVAAERPGARYYLGRAWHETWRYLVPALAVWGGGVALWCRWRSESGNSEARKP